MEALSQEIKFSKMRNFRELGGYKAADGRHIKHNVFFRAPALSQLETKEDYEKFKSFGIKVICDFRSNAERTLKPDPEFEGVRHHSISALYKNDGTEMNFDFREMVHASKEELDGILALLDEGYYNLGLNNPAYKMMFKEICEGNTPILFHCSAGKDRTGVAAALILSLFGVDREDIVNDYLMTNKYSAKDVLKRSMCSTTENIPAETLKVIDTLSGVQRKNLEKTLDAVLAKYGTMENYFEKVYGITEEKRKELYDKYLE